MVSLTKPLQVYTCTCVCLAIHHSIFLFKPISLPLSLPLSLSLSLSPSLSLSLSLSLSFPLSLSLSLSLSLLPSLSPSLSLSLPPSLSLTFPSSILLNGVKQMTRPSNYSSVLRNHDIPDPNKTSKHISYNPKHYSSPKNCPQTS